MQTLKVSTSRVSGGSGTHDQTKEHGCHTEGSRPRNVSLFQSSQTVGLAFNLASSCRFCSQCMKNTIRLTERTTWLLPLRPNLRQSNLMTTGRLKRYTTAPALLHFGDAS